VGVEGAREEERDDGGWDAVSPGMRLRGGLLHFAATAAAPAGAATVPFAAAKCRWGRRCSDCWR
jgi:hypothetical protein